jgi:TonB family protein
MNALFLFLLKAALINALMLGFYHFAIRPGHNLRLMRVVLMLSIVLPLLLPILPQAFLQGENSEVPVYVFSLPTVTNEVVITPQQSTNLIPLIQNAIYLSFMALLLMGTIFSVLSIIRKYRIARETSTPYGKVLIDNASLSPYSFFKWVFFSEKSLQHPSAHFLLRHEFSHVKHGHSFDRLLSAIFRAVFWFSPFAHFNYKLLAEVHEYQADADAIEDYGNKTAYSKLIVSFAGISGQNQITNPFSAHLKKRMIMINNLKPGKLHLLRIAAGVSIIAAFALLSSMVIPAADMSHIGNALISSPATSNTTDTPAVLPPVQIISAGTILSDDTIHPAEFPGGDEARIKFYQNNIRYPLEARNQNIQGTVQYKVFIETDGTVTTPSIVSGIGGGCDEEVLRVAALMPKWKPAMKDGKPVRTSVILPIKFTLSGEAPIDENEQVFAVVEEIPKFPGGDEARATYLQKVISYPEKAKKEKIEGTVYVSFIIEKNGSISNVKVLRGIGGGCDEMAVSAIQNMPAWTPGMQHGKPVRVQFNMPISFKLTDKDKTTLSDVPAPSEINEVPAKPTGIDQEVFVVVEDSPVFPGGDEAKQKYLVQNITYPQEARKQGIQGTVYVTFVIDKDGSVTNSKVLRGVHPLLDAEALRVVNGMPAWNPGKQQGKAVRVQFNMPIKFSLGKTILR